MPDGKEIGQWNPPWKIYSTGFLGVSNGLVETTYNGITIYPGQSVELFAFEKMDMGRGFSIMGLNVPPVLARFSKWPPIFWEISNLPTNVKTPLTPAENYTTRLSLYCEELAKRINASFNIKWDQRPKIIMQSK